MPRILVIPPHPDDEVLGCGGSIAAHTAAGSEVVIGYLTSGERGGSLTGASDLGHTREQEALAAGAILGVPAEQVCLLRIPDGGINAYDVGQFGAVVRLLRDVRPDVLYVPHPYDGAFDHEAAFALCWRAAGMASSRNYPQWGEPHWVPTILGFEVWTPIVQPAFLRDITAVVDQKLAALDCYRTQVAGARGPDQSTLVGPACLHLSGFRGASTTGGHREAFAVLRLGEVIL
jgi:LmbE family N-acetylglucosaminyl deacetylase